MLRYGELSRQPKVFKLLTGLGVDQFDEVAQDVVLALGRAEHTRRELEQRGLAGPVAAQHHDRLTGLDGPVHRL